MGVIKKLSIAAIFCLLANPSLAYDVVIDTFDEGVNTATLQSFLGVPVMGEDTGLATVIGGTRALLVEGDLLVEAGVIPLGLMDYMSNQTGFAMLTYDGGGAGFGNLIACAAAIEVAFLAADAAAQGVATGQAQITVALTGGATVAVSRPIAAAAGTLTYPIADFAGVDLQNLTEIAMTIDGSVSDSADLGVDSIRAVGCEAPPSPSPAMGPVALAFGALVLTGLGLLGVARRRLT